MDEVIPVEEEDTFPLDLLNEYLDEDLDDEESEGEFSEGSSEKRRDPSTGTEYSSNDEIKQKVDGKKTVTIDESALEMGLPKSAAFERRSLIRRRR